MASHGTSHVFSDVGTDRSSPVSWSSAIPFSLWASLPNNHGGNALKTKKQLDALIEMARTQKASGALKGRTTEADDTSTNSWGPQMRV